MSLLIKFITIFLSVFIFSTSIFSKEYLQDTSDIDRLKLWEELRDSILPNAPIEQAFDYACLYLSINPKNLDVYKGGFVRYGKVNKKKILGYIELIESQSMDLTDCDLNKD